MSSEIHYDLYEDLSDNFDIVRYKPETGFERVKNPVVREMSLRIFLNDDEIIVLQCLKNEVKELALGFLFTECVINNISSVSDIREINGLHAVRVNTNEKPRLGNIPTVRSITTGCGAGVTFIPPAHSAFFAPLNTPETLSGKAIPELMKKLMESSRLAMETGGVHTAALSDGEELIHISDDIGRHNGIDKVIGWDLINKKFDSPRRVLLTSGRLSSDIVSKSIRGKAQFLISYSAPTRGAVQLARDFGITLVGLVRGESYNIFSHEERIVE